MHLHRQLAALGKYFANMLDYVLFMLLEDISRHTRALRDELRLSGLSELLGVNTKSNILGGYICMLIILRLWQKKLQPCHCIWFVRLLTQAFVDLVCQLVFRTFPRCCSCWCAHLPLTLPYPRTVPTVHVSISSSQSDDIWEHAQSPTPNKCRRSSKSSCICKCTVKSKCISGPRLGSCSLWFTILKTPLQSISPTLLSHLKS